MEKKNQQPQQPQQTSQSDGNQSFELTEEELSQVSGAGTSSGGTGFGRYFENGVGGSGTGGIG